MRRVFNRQISNKISYNNLVEIGICWRAELRDLWLDFSLILIGPRLRRYFLMTQMLTTKLLSCNENKNKIFWMKFYWILEQLGLLCLQGIVDYLLNRKKYFLQHRQMIREKKYSVWKIYSTMLAKPYRIVLIDK